MSSRLLANPWVMSLKRNFGLSGGATGALENGLRLKKGYPDKTRTSVYRRCRGHSGSVWRDHGSLMEWQTKQYRRGVEPAKPAKKSTNIISPTIAGVFFGKWSAPERIFRPYDFCSLSASRPLAGRRWPTTSFSSLHNVLTWTPDTVEWLGRMKGPQEVWKWVFSLIVSWFLLKAEGDVGLLFWKAIL